jgi:membrane-associated protease RseP (regulator of RpoE activity)
MGVYLTYSGMQMVTPGHVLGVASNPMYNTTTISGALSSALTYPFRGMEGYSPVPEEFQWWFDAPGGNLFWGGAVLMYWMFWVNLLLGITNALPLIPFDGGYLFRGWVTQLLEKIRYKDEKAREEAAKNIASAVSGVMAFLLILIVFVVLWY